MDRPVRVLIVDDSPIVRRVLTAQLSAQEGIEVVGDAPDPYVARERIVALKPDVITLDIEMPRMDGLSFLRKLMKFHPVPAIILSSIAQRGTHTAIECLEAGAIAVFAKPNGPTSVGDVSRSLAEVIRGARDVRLKNAAAPTPTHTPPPRPATPPPAEPSGPRRPSRRVIAIGASTGGTEALRDILTALPADLPGIAIVQHMPAGFTQAFAARLNTLCTIEVREAKDGDPIRTGEALIAPGDTQMKLIRAESGWAVRVFDGPRVCRHKPSVEVLFTSAAETAGSKATGVILTGMGGDGARGLKAMRDAGAHTIAQDKETCVVFGMPRVAIEAGGAAEVLPLPKIPAAIVAHARPPSAAAAA
jgi:two-component system, chemotaxis family, protein-glutamate methylesterase/glutaminase